MFCALICVIQIGWVHFPMAGQPEQDTNHSGLFNNENQSRYHAFNFHENGGGQCL